MADLKNVTDLPEAQQKVLFTILQMAKPAFLTSEVHKKLSNQMAGRSVGALLGALYRNGFLEKLQGGRDKRWKLSVEVYKSREIIREQLSELRKYWS